MKEMGRTLAVAESCTGGLLGGALTAVPGASVVFVGGVIAYANQVKESALGVPAALLEAHGAVSVEVVEAMAQGARVRLAADWALAVSGIAGPEGGTPEKPVGTVVIACLGPKGGMVESHRFEGEREAVRRQAVAAALELGLRTSRPGRA